MILSESGTMSARVFSAAEAEPIAGAVVRIKGAEEANRFFVYSLTTDIDGITEAVALPAPSVNYSQAPMAQESPYAIYDVEISKDGFYSKRIFSVAVFSGVNAVLPVNMIPSGAQDSVYPHGNINAIITENEKLE